MIAGASRQICVASHRVTSLLLQRLSLSQIRPHLRRTARHTRGLLRKVVPHGLEREAVRQPPQCTATRRGALPRPSAHTTRRETCHNTTHHYTTRPHNKPLPPDGQPSASPPVQDVPWSCPNMMCSHRAICTDTDVAEHSTCGLVAMTSG